MGTITMTRMTNAEKTEGVVRVEIKDDSGKRIVNSYMSLENFALAVTGRSEVPFDVKR